MTDSVETYLSVGDNEALNSVQEKSRETETSLEYVHINPSDAEESDVNEEVKKDEECEDFKKPETEEEEVVENEENPSSVDEDVGNQEGESSVTENEEENSASSSWETDEIVEDSAEEMFKKLSAENRIMHRTIDDDNLPPTVSLLTGENGEKVYLIGTAHFSKESCDDVRNIITQAQPDIVMVELCRGRTDLLLNDEDKLLELAGDVSFDKIVKQIKHKGLVSGVMTFLLLHMSAHITKQLGMAPGGEFRAAFHESRKIPGCRLLFGDRAVEVTLQRAFSTFSMWQKLKFALSVMKDLGPIKPEDIEKLKEKDMLEQALGDMMGEFPEMTSVFLAERDIYLAKSLQKAISTKIRTEAEEVPPVVVGVVGLGHAAGIREKFGTEITEEDIMKLMEIPKPSKLRIVIKFVLKWAALLGTVYGAYKVIRWTGGWVFSMLPQSLWGRSIENMEESAREML